MADEHPPASPAPFEPQPPHVTPPLQLTVPPAQPILTQPIQAAYIPHWNWSHFKPEFTGKPDEDVEAHPLRMNNWMDTHAFPEGVKVQHFCPTLVGEARLGYESLRPINVDWIWLQISLDSNTLKIGNTREQLFHAWRSFHFNENTETLDSYVACIRHVATLLGYGDIQVLEVFKNTLPAWLYLVLLPIQDLGQTVETAKTILTKEKIDRQLAGQSSSAPFMNIKDGYISKKVTFGIQDSLD